jgi:hypothetical protein
VHVTIRVACQQEGIFYLTAGPEDFPPRMTILNRDSWGSTIAIGNFQLSVEGEIVTGGARGRVSVSGRPGATEFCSGSGTTKGHAVWYADMGKPHYFSVK